MIAVMLPARAANIALAVQVLVAAAGCTRPREQVLHIPPLTQDPTPTGSDFVEAPHPPIWVNGTVEATFAADAPVMVAGVRRIQPDLETRREIGRSGIEEVTGSFALCSNADGVPFQITLTRSTGHAAYDRELEEGIRGWRFIPHEVHGEYISTCTDVQFSYRPWR
jgi:hypothetical protein